MVYEISPPNRSPRSDVLATALPIIKRQLACMTWRDWLKASAAGMAYLLINFVLFVLFWAITTPPA